MRGQRKIYAIESLRSVMKRVSAIAITTSLLLCATSASAIDQTYADSVSQWRTKVEASLKRDNGWLTLAGRYVMKSGENTIGSAKNNDIVLPEGVGPQRLGSMIIDEKMVLLKLADGITMKAQEGEFKGERVMVTSGESRDWVALGKMAFHVIERRGTYVLRLADNGSLNRKNFPGRVWYGVNEGYRLEGKFVPFESGKTIQIVDVIDELHDMASPGYVEFKLNGKTMKLDAVADPGDNELFIIMKDETAGKGTYNAGRFLVVEWPEAVRDKGGPVTVDFNKAYNPPCAFSDFTTCPLPPEQNILKARVEAGEKYQPKKLAGAS
jgi:uncharacterized protein (DUF1684 family)